MEGEKRYEEVVQNKPDLLAEDPLALADRRSTREKITTSAIILVAFLGVIAGYWQLSQGLNVSKLLGKSMTQTAEAPVASLDFQKDTDSDGLTDYEEQFTHKTSPYLEDSDSDGMTDKEEIDAGYDPNCPGMESCGALVSGDGGAVVDITQSAGASQLSPDRLRELLKASGATDEQLSALSDEDLLSLYQQAAAQSGGQFTSGAPVTTGGAISAGSTAGSTGNTDLAALGIDSIADLQQLSGAQIRELLIKQGAPADVLQQVSDDQLKQMFITQIESKLKESQ